MDLIVTADADVTKALSKLDALKAKVGQLTENQQGLKNVINDLNTSLRLNEKELTDATVKLQKLNTTTTAGKIAAANLRKEIAQLAANSNTLGTSLNTAKASLANTTTNLKAATVELKKAETATGGFSGGATKAWSALRLLANIIPGLGIGGLVAIIAGPVVSAFQSWWANTNRVSEASKTLKANLANLNEIVAEANKEAGKQTASLKILYQAATDVNLSSQERLKAVKALQDLFPEYFKNIDAETIKNGGAKAAYDALSLSILATSRAKAAKGKIDELEAKRLDNDFKRQKILNATAAEAARAQDRILKGASGAADVNITRAEQLKVIKARKEAALAIIDLDDKSLAAQEAFLIKFAGLPTVAKVIEDGIKRDKPGAIKAVETINDVLKKMEHELKVLGQIELLKNIDKAKEKIAILEKAQLHLIDTLNQTSQSPLILDLEFRIDKIKLEEKVAEIENITKDLTIPIPITVTPPKPVEAKKAVTATLAIVDQLNQQIADSLENMLTSSLSGIGEAIGNTIAKGGDLGQAIFGNLFTVLADGLKQIGESLIALGTAKIAIEKFKFAPGIGTVLAGIATVALASILKASMPKFATGGFVTGPGSSTSDSINARLSKGEYIIRASKVAEFGKGFFDMINAGGRPKNGGYANGGLVSGNIGGGMVITVNVVGRMRNKEIYFANQQAGQTIGRNG